MLMEPFAVVSDHVYLSRLEVRFSADPRDIYQTTSISGGAPGQRKTREVQRWRRDRVLGRGGFGKVYLEKCMEGSEEGEVRAVKEMRKLVDDNYNRELEAAALFSHPKYEENFVRSFGWYESETGLFLTMEYFPLGDLQKYLGVPKPEVEGQLITNQVLEGLEFMHERGFTHRDLKPANILVSSTGPNWWVKIADFGISKRAQQGVTSLHTQVFTPGFAAPEVFFMHMMDDDDDRDGYDAYTNAVDIWSAGSVTFMILTGEAIFSDSRELRRYYKGKAELPLEQLDVRHLSSSCRDFLKTLLACNPEDRPAASRALDHPWVRRDESIAHRHNQVAASVRSVNEPSTMLETAFDIPPPSARWTTLSEETGPPLSKTTPSETDEETIRQSVTRMNISESQNPRTAESYPSSEVLCLKYHTSTITALVTCPNGNLLIYTAEDSSINYWDLKGSTAPGHNGVLETSQGPLWSHSISPDGVKYIAISLDGKMLISRTKSAKILIWKIGNQYDGLQKLKSIDVSGDGTGFEPVMFSPNGAYAAWTDGEGHLCVYDLQKHKLRLKVMHPSFQRGSFLSKLDSGRRVTTAAFSPDSQYIVSGADTSALEVVNIWDIISGTRAYILLETVDTGNKRDYVHKVRFSPRGHIAATFRFGSSIRVWDHNRRHLHSLERNSRARDIAFSPSSALLLSTRYDTNTIRVWNMDDGALFGSIDSGAPRGTVRLKISPDGRFVAAVGLHGVAVLSFQTTGHVWRNEDFRLLKRDPRFEYATRNARNSFTFTRDGKVFTWAHGSDVYFVQLDDCR